MKQVLGATALSVLLLTGCLKKEERSCPYDECGRVAPASEIAAVQAYLNNNGITGAVQHCSGTFYTVVNPGSGSSVNACSTVTVAYGGYLTNGNRFDSSAQASFGLANLIPAWPMVVPKIRVGGELVMYVPPSLGYGSTAVGSIPANSILIFRVKLNGVN